MTNQARLDNQDGFGDLVFVSNDDPPPVAERNAPLRNDPPRNDPPRVLVGLKGHYKLEGWRDAEGNEREFPCEVVKISPHMIKLAASATGAVGNWVVVQLDYLGKFEGPIVQVLPRALVMKIFGTNDDRAKVASKLAWITDTEKPEGRRYPRMVPTDPESTISLPENTVLPCQVIDYSAGGAAVYAEANPEMGTVVKIGKVAGRVVRQFGGGFAVSFLTLQDIQQVEASIVQPVQPSEP
jgi:hypothetical protein